MRPTDTRDRMRLAALTLLALALSASAATGAAKAPNGSLAIVDGRGLVQINGKGALLGKIEKGTLEIVDLTTDDQWSPRVNGVPRGHRVWLRGKKISFRVPTGRYRVTARGTGISISAQGSGVAVLSGDPDPAGETGLYAVSGATCFGTDTVDCLPLPADVTKVSFGLGDGGASSSQPGTIQQ
jgi:hypothetical protein